MDKLHYGNGPRPEQGCGAVQDRRDYASETADIIVNHLVQILDVNYNDRRIVGALLKANLGNPLNDLLEQFLHTQLDEVVRSNRHRFKLSQNVTPDYAYAPHAKLATFIDAIVSGEKKTGEPDDKERKDE